MKVLVVLMKLPWQHVLPEGVGCADEVAMASLLTDILHRRRDASGEVN